MTQNKYLVNLVGYQIWLGIKFYAKQSTLIFGSLCVILVYFGLLWVVSANSVF